MPLCKKCNTVFKNLIKIEGKIRNLNKRKYCLNCSPFKSHNTKKLEQEKKKRVEVECICKKCKTNYKYIRGRGNTKSYCSSCLVSFRRQQTRDKLIIHLGGKCSQCGYNKLSCSLDFHHKDKEQKEFELSMRNINRSYSSLLKEANKCILLCANCHREIHCSHNSAV